MKDFHLLIPITVTEASFIHQRGYTSDFLHFAFDKGPEIFGVLFQVRADNIFHLLFMSLSGVCPTACLYNIPVFLPSSCLGFSLGSLFPPCGTMYSCIDSWVGMSRGKHFRWNKLIHST